jgi:hypothetical protein
MFQIIGVFAQFIALRRQTSAGQTVEVGLFDSGFGAVVYRALVTSVIKPVGERRHCLGLSTPSSGYGELVDTL